MSDADLYCYPSCNMTCYFLVFVKMTYTFQTYLVGVSRAGEMLLFRRIQTDALSLNGRRCQRTTEIMNHYCF